MAGSEAAPYAACPPPRPGEHGAPWLVGLLLRRPHDRLIRVSFLVTGDVTAVQAVFRARLRASRLVEFERWRDALVDASWTEVRRLRRDLLGHVELTGPFPGPPDAPQSP